LPPVEYDENLVNIHLQQMLGKEVYSLCGGRESIIDPSEILRTKPEQIAEDVREEHEEVLRRKMRES